MSEILNVECDCCHEKSDIDKLKVVCSKCFKEVQHIHNTTDLFKQDWEVEDNGETTYNHNS